MIQPLAKALRAVDDHFCMAHTFALSEGGVVKATDPFRLRFMSKFEIVIMMLRKAEKDVDEDYLFQSTAGIFCCH